MMTVLPLRLKRSVRESAEGTETGMLSALFCMDYLGRVGVYDKCLCVVNTRPVEKTNER